MQLAAQNPAARHVAAAALPRLPSAATRPPFLNTPGRAAGRAATRGGGKWRRGAPPPRRRRRATPAACLGLAGKRGARMGGWVGGWGGVGAASVGTGSWAAVGLCSSAPAAQAARTNRQGRSAAGPTWHRFVFHHRHIRVQSCQQHGFHHGCTTGGGPTDQCCSRAEAAVVHPATTLACSRHPFLTEGPFTLAWVRRIAVARR